ncbi:MAG TPA: hypothetical protein VG694_00290 [Candidatus Paceibacterota bacterium]|jgi:hypothetical protein|nr:hypothetical protein [Candidatus Paceibacterota bacterium]
MKSFFLTVQNDATASLLLLIGLILVIYLFFGRKKGEMEVIKEEKGEETDYSFSPHESFD